MGATLLTLGAGTDVAGPEDGGGARAVTIGAGIGLGTTTGGVTSTGTGAGGGVGTEGAGGIGTGCSTSPRLRCGVVLTTGEGKDRSGALLIAGSVGTLGAIFCTAAGVACATKGGAGGGSGSFGGITLTEGGGSGKVSKYKSLLVSANFNR